MLQKLAFAILVILASGRLLAQQPAPEWGIDDLSDYVVTSWDMQTGGSQSVFDATNYHRYLTEFGTFIGAVHLPQGAQIVSISLEACDDTSGSQVDAHLVRASASATIFLDIVNTGNVQTPGCGFTTSDLVTPETVNNGAYRYLVFSSNSSYDGTTTVGAVRIRYRLQVSIPPADATFGDVPTS